MDKPKYRRVLLKISGEALAADKGFGIDSNYIDQVGACIKKLTSLGVQVAIVVGGGNFWRGRDCSNMNRVTADQVGMLGTTMNALALADALERVGQDNRVMSAIEMRQITELYIRKRALRHLEKGRVLIFAAGTGNPYFSTDSAAALRAAEINANILLKATNVDGVYTADPKKDENARLFRHLKHDEVLQKKLQVMDATAAALCRDNGIQICVFNMNNLDNIIDIVCGKEVGTLVD